jgi:hypothetical protein
MKTTYRKMTDLEAKRAEALGKCTLPPCTAVKRFARSLCYQIAKLEISEKQAAFLEVSCYRFRRQLPAMLVPSEPPAAYLKHVKSARRDAL